MPVSIPAVVPHRIALFMRSLGSGGAERVIANLARGFAERGFKVDLVLSKAEGVYLDQIPATVRVIDLESEKLNSPVKRLRLPTSFQSTTSLLPLVKYLQQERPAVLLAATHYTNEIAILAKRLARIPTRIIVSEHTTLSLECQRVEQVSARLIPFTARMLYPLADGIVAVSHGVASDLAGLAGVSPKRIQVIYNPVVMPELPQRAQEPIPHPWLQPGEPPVILGIGRFVEQKDFPTLIRAFAQVRQQRPARLMLLGGGRGRSQLQALVTETGLASEVVLLDFVKNPYAYMARAAVFALSSSWEGLPTVVIEAMAVGLPIVSTNCPSGPAEILDHGRYGNLVPVGDSSAMAKAILAVLDGQTSPIEPTWLNQFSLQTAVEKYLNLFGLAAA